MKVYLKKFGIVLIVCMFIMPAWSVQLGDTNTKDQESKNLKTKNFPLSKEPLKIQTPLNSNFKDNTTNQLQYQECLKTSSILNKLILLFIPIQILENNTYLNTTNVTYNKTNVTYIESLNNTNLDTIQKAYNQTLTEYNSCFEDLNTLNTLNEDLNVNQTHLESLQNYLINEKTNFVVNETNRKELDDLSSRLNDTNQKISIAKQVQKEVEANINTLTQKKNDYETVLSALNKTLKDKKITPETQNTIKTIANKYNQTLTDTDNNSQSTEPDNTSFTSTKPDNTSSTDNEIINSSGADNNNSTDDTPTNDTNSTVNDNEDILCGVYGAIAGFSALSYSLPVITKFWNIYKTGSAPTTLTNYFMHHLDKLRNQPISEASAAVPVENAIATSSEVIDLADISQVRKVIGENVLKYPDMAKLTLSEANKLKLLDMTTLDPLCERIDKFVIGVEELDQSSLIYMGLEGKNGAKSAMNELFVLASEDQETFYKMMGITLEFEEAVEGAAIKLCTPCRTLFGIGTFLSVASAFMDVWTVASIISLAGKEFNWWKKDYVNDWLPINKWLHF